MKFSMQNHSKEASIVAQAGRLGAVTLATNMAERGTDIILGNNSNTGVKHKLKPSASQAVLDEWEKIEDFVNKSVSTTKSRLATPREHEILQQIPETLVSEIGKTRDIFADEQSVLNAGGLFILGTERHESRRIDNQLRGRADRETRAHLVSICR